MPCRKPDYALRLLRCRNIRITSASWLAVPAAPTARVSSGRSSVRDEAIHELLDHGHASLPDRCIGSRTALTARPFQTCISRWARRDAMSGGRPSPRSSRSRVSHASQRFEDALIGIRRAAAICGSASRFGAHLEVQRRIHHRQGPAQPAVESVCRMLAARSADECSCRICARPPPTGARRWPRRWRSCSRNNGTSGRRSSARLSAMFAMLAA